MMCAFALSSIVSISDLLFSLKVLKESKNHMKAFESTEFKLRAQSSGAADFCFIRSPCLFLE